MGNIATLLLTYFPVYGYIGLFFVILIAGTYVPIPDGIILIAVGAFARSGHINIFLAFIAALAGSVVSDTITFYIARHIGKRDSYRKYVQNHAYAKRIETFAKKYPKGTIIVSRFIGVITIPVDVLMGLSQIRLSTFVSMDAIGNSICTIAYLCIGYVIGMTAAQSTHFSTVIVGCLAAVALVYVAAFAATNFIKK